jgi:hypothetical protein
MYFLFSGAGLIVLSALFSPTAEMPGSIAPLFKPPTEYEGKSGKYKTILRFNDGRDVRNATDWTERRAEIRVTWEKEIGAWPALIEKPRLEIVRSTQRETFTQQRIRIETAPRQMTDGYLLIPTGQGPFPAVVVPYYEPESSVGLGKVSLRDFGSQLVRRGFVSLSIGSPGGDARRPDVAGASCQPLHCLGYVAANCYNALANLPTVDPARIGIAGHSYGGKWAMFGACFYEKFACGVWSDPGIVFDETRPNVNYWEHWYLGSDPSRARSPGVPNKSNPRTGAYRRLYENGHDLHEVLALMAPRPFLVSGGAEDRPERWAALNRVKEVYALLGATNRVAMSNRPLHEPTQESNEQIYGFFQHFLGGAGVPAK